MPLSLINKKIIISGGASGIGWSTAKICLSRGAIVYICDIDINSLKKAQKHPLNKKKLLLNLNILTNLKSFALCVVFFSNNFTKSVFFTNLNFNSFISVSSNIIQQTMNINM